MKKIIITLSIIFLFISQTFAEISFSDKGNFNNNLSEILFLKSQLQNYEDEIKTLKENNKDINSKYINLKSDKFESSIKINELKNLNSKLELKNKKLEKQINSDNFKGEIIKNYFTDRINDFKNLTETQTGTLVLGILYILSSLFLFIFFFIYTLPLRILRAIWRKITGYKENNCDPNLNNKFNSLFKKYKSLKEDKAELAHHISELEKINIRMKMQNSSFKKDLQELENFKVRKQIEENKKIKKSNFSELYSHKKEINSAEDLFIFEDIKKEDKKKQTDNLTTTKNIINIETKKSKKIEKKSFILKDRSDLFGKKKKEKFSLGGNKKGGLFD